MYIGSVQRLLMFMDSKKILYKFLSCMEMHTGLHLHYHISLMYNTVRNTDNAKLFRHAVVYIIVILSHSGMLVICSKLLSHSGPLVLLKLLSHFGTLVMCIILSHSGPLVLVKLLSHSGTLG